MKNSTEKLLPSLFSLIYSDSIVWRYVQPTSLDPVTISCFSINNQLIQTAEKPKLYTVENGKYFAYSLKYHSQKENTYYQFETVSKKELIKRELTVNYQTNIFIKLANNNKLAEFINDAYLFNIEQKQIEDSINNFIRSNSEDKSGVAKFILRLNNKIDKLTELIEAEDRYKEFLPLRAVAINSQSITVSSTQKIDVDSIGYCELVIEDEIRSKFASTVSFKLFHQTDQRYFYSCKFIDLTKNVKDRLINYLFNKERQLIKEIRSVE